MNNTKTNKNEIEEFPVQIGEALTKIQFPVQSTPLLNLASDTPRPVPLLLEKGDEIVEIVLEKNRQVNKYFGDKLFIELGLSTEDPRETSELATFLTRGIPVKGKNLNKAKHQFRQILHFTNKVVPVRVGQLLLSIKGDTLVPNEIDMSVKVRRNANYYLFGRLPPNNSA